MGIRNLSDQHGGGGASGNLDDLGDVNAPSPADNEVLAWDDGAGEWSPASGAVPPVTTKGDLYGYSTAAARIPVGTDGHVLTADSGQALGLKWSAAGAGGEYWTEVVLASAFQTTSTAAQDTNLAFTPAASKAYLVRVMAILASTLGSVGAQIGVKWPTAGLASGAARIVAPSSSTNLQFVTLSVGTDGESQIASGMPANAWGIQTVDALFVTNGSISGDFIITLASEAGDVETMTMGAGSILQYREVA